MTESIAPDKPAVAASIRKDPALALVLSVIAPGLGHLYTGSWKRGVLWFFAANLCFFTGLALAGSAIFQWSGATAIPPAAPKLFLLLLLPLPEILNLSATLFGAMQFLSPGAAYPQVVSDLTVLGSLLTAASGMMALFCMVDVWGLAKGAAPMEAPSVHRSPMVATMLSWAIPGLGHFYLKRRFHGWLFCLSIHGLFAMGLALGSSMVCNREKVFYYWAGQYLAGIPTAVASWVGQSLRVERFLPYQDLGLLFVTAAGLLNVLVMLSAYSMARGEKT